MYIDVKMYTGWQDSLKCFVRSLAVRFVGKCEMFETRLHIGISETSSLSLIPTWSVALSHIILT